MKKAFIFKTFFILAILGTCSAVFSDEIKPIKLPAPQQEGGKPIMQAFKDRRSMREFSSRELPLQMLSDILWAACGINRPDTGGRTSPTAKNMQEIDVYAARSDGLYLYDAKNNMLVPVLVEDIRELTGKQSFVKDAPLNLVFVADFAKMAGMAANDAEFYAATDTGFVSENVYLFCASNGLATVVRGMVDKPMLAKAMKLRPDQRVVLAQTVGYPKD